MTRRLHLDPPRRLGARTLAVLCETRTVAQQIGGAILARGHKVPLALLVAEGGIVTATDLTGRPLDPALLEAALLEAALLEADCPGLLAALEVAAIPP